MTTNLGNHQINIFAKINKASFSKARKQILTLQKQMNKKVIKLNVKTVQSKSNKPFKQNNKSNQENLKFDILKTTLTEVIKEKQKKERLLEAQKRSNELASWFFVKKLAFDTTKIFIQQISAAITHEREAFSKSRKNFNIYKIQRENLQYLKNLATLSSENEDDVQNDFIKLQDKIVDFQVGKNNDPYQNQILSALLQIRDKKNPKEVLAVAKQTFQNINDSNLNQIDETKFLSAFRSVYGESLTNVLADKNFSTREDKSSKKQYNVLSETRADKSQDYLANIKFNFQNLFQTVSPIAPLLQDILAAVAYVGLSAVIFKKVLDKTNFFSMKTKLTNVNLPKLTKLKDFKFPKFTTPKILGFAKNFNPKALIGIGATILISKLYKMYNKKKEKEREIEKNNLNNIDNKNNISVNANLNINVTNLTDKNTNLGAIDNIVEKVSNVIRNGLIQEFSTI